MSINSNFGIPDERAKAITKEYAGIIKPIFESGKLSGSATLEAIMGMQLTDQERTWLAYHVGGINAMILYGKAKGKKIIINW
jgi:hypothetical protein